MEVYDFAHFNPRSREGSDNNAQPNIYGQAISIHAPARGATRWFRKLLPPYIYFNPRSREGSDHIQSHKNSTSINFNPRSREGSDLTRLHRSNLYLLFQSTLPRGERPSSTATKANTAAISIHAPARGATIYIGV